jgi:hypothetical protein
MKNFIKITTSTLLVAALANCDFNFSTGSSDSILPVDEANTRVMMEVMFNMMNITEGSFEIEVSVDGMFETVVY